MVELKVEEESSLYLENNTSDLKDAVIINSCTEDKSVWDNE